MASASNQPPTPHEMELTLNPHIDCDIDILFADPGTNELKCVAVTDIDVMAGALSTSHERILLVVASPVMPFSSFTPLLTTSGASDQEPGIILFSTVRHQVGAEMVDGTLIIGGPRIFLSNVGRRLRNTTLEVICASDRADRAYQRVVPVGSQPNPVKKATYQYCVVKLPELSGFFCNQNVTMYTKISSILYFSFPNIRGYIADHFDLIPIPAAGVRMGLQSISSDVIRMIAIAACLFTGAYSQQDKLYNQIYTRLKAAAAQYEAVAPTKQEVETLLTSIGWTTLELPTLFIKCYQNLICVSADGSIDPLVKIGDLMPLATYVERYRISDWAKCMLEQIRMIYKDYHATSIRFAMASSRILTSYMTALSVPWSTELTRTQDLIDRISESPYSGIVDVVPESQRVNHIPRMTYMGLLIYQANLKSQEEKDNFKAYNVDGVKAHIDPSSDADLCAGIVSILPAGNLKTIIELAHLLSSEDTETMIAGLSPGDKEIIYKSLLREDNPGEWAKMERRRRRAQEIERIKRGALESLDVIQREAVNSHNEALHRIADPIERNNKMSEHLEWVTRIDQERRSLSSLNSVVPYESSTEFSDARKRVVKDLARLYTIMTNPASTPDDRIRALTAENSRDAIGRDDLNDNEDNVPGDQQPEAGGDQQDQAGDYPQAG